MLLFFMSQHGPGTGPTPTDPEGQVELASVNIFLTTYNPNFVQLAAANLWLEYDAEYEPPPPEFDPVEWRTDRVPANYTLSEGNTAYIQSGSSNYTRWLQSDREIGELSPEDVDPVFVAFYWEVELTAGAAAMDGYIGVVNAAWANISTSWDGTTNPLSEGSLGYRGNGSIWGINGTQRSAFQASYGNGDRVMIAFNPWTGEFWTGKNGVWDREPGVDAPRTTTTPGIYRASAHGRGNGDAGRLHSIPEDFVYDIPEGCIPLAAPEPVIQIPWDETDTVVRDMSLFAGFVSSGYSVQVVDTYIGQPITGLGVQSFDLWVELDIS